MGSVWPPCCWEPWAQLLEESLMIFLWLIRYEPWKWTHRCQSLEEPSRHQVEPFSMQVWYQWNQNKADGNGSGDYPELKSVLERQNVAWIPRGTSGDISWVLLPRHQICSQDLLNASSLAVSASNLSRICSQDWDEADWLVVSRETALRKWWVQVLLKALLSRLCGAGFLPVFMETGTGIHVAKCWVLGWGYRWSVQTGTHLQKQTAETPLSAPAKPNAVCGSTHQWLQSVRDSGYLSWPFCWPHRAAA